MLSSTINDLVLTDLIWGKADGRILYSKTILMSVYQTQTQTTFYFPKHMIMAQGNTCTYITDLTNNNNSGDSISSSG